MADDDDPKQPQLVAGVSSDAVETRGGREAAPPPHRLMAIIRFLAENATERVIFTDHAQDRMEERDFTSEQVFRGLRTGEISGRITRGRGSDEWKCKVVSTPRGSRKMGVVTIIIRNECLVVKTVEWEDR